MRPKVIAAWVGVVLLLVVALQLFRLTLGSSDSPGDSASNPPTQEVEVESSTSVPGSTAKGAESDSECPRPSHPELNQAVADFETAFRSRNAATTEESLRLALQPFVEPSLLATLDLREHDSNANRSLARQTVTVTVENPLCTLRPQVFENGTDAYVEATVRIVRTDGDAVVLDFTTQHETWWRLTDVGWQLVAMKGGAS